MALVVLVLLVAVPVVELAAFIAVADGIGALPAAALLVLSTVGGIALVKREGLGAWRRAQERFRTGEVPATDLLNGLLILVAGALMAIPGFVTDVFGLLLLVPPVRALVRTLAFGRFERRLKASVVTGPGGMSFGTAEPGRVFTGRATYGAVDVREVRVERSDRSGPAGSPDPGGPSGSRHGGVGELEP